MAEAGCDDQDRKAVGSVPVDCVLVFVEESGREDDVTDAFTCPAFGCFPPEVGELLVS